MNKLTSKAFIAVAFLSSVLYTNAQERPNIVVVLLDDLGYADVGFNGATDIPTPSLDALAEQGTILTSAYVSHPFCGPSRMSIMTGRYPHNMGVQYNHPWSGEGSELGIPTNDRTIGRMLQKAGYYTGLMGKWHLGKEDQFHPNSMGFDDFYGFLGGGHVYHPEDFVYNYNANTWDYKLPIQHNGVEVTETEYVTDGLTREGVRFINEASAKDQPFFLFMSYNAPHTPLEAKAEDLTHPTIAAISDASRKSYSAMVYSVDRGMEQLVNALKANNEYENTLIVFFSDNGGRTDQGARNTPLRGRKGDTYEGGIRVPMFMHWPGTVPADVTYDHPVSALDLYPTFAHLAEHNVHSNKILDGVDVWDDLVAGEDARPGDPIYALRHRAGFNNVGVRRDNWKLFRLNNSSSFQLFDMNNDPGESTNLSGQHPELVDTLVALAERWSQSHYDAFFFDSPGAKDGWESNNMPRYDLTFGDVIDLGLGAAPGKGPVPLFVATEEWEEEEEENLLWFIHEPGFQLYPNPAVGELYISFGESNTLPKRVEIFNMTGRVVFTQKLPDNLDDGIFRIEIDPNIPFGSYLIRLDGTNFKSQRVVLGTN